MKGTCASKRMRSSELRVQLVLRDEDPDESTIVLDLRKICLVADADGNASQRQRPRTRSLHGLRRHRYRSPRDIQAMVRAATASRTPKIFWTERRNATAIASDPLRHRYSEGSGAVLRRYRLRSRK